MIRRLALGFYALGILVFRRAIMDDTFIHLQYARNLRAHAELAFNHGMPSLGASSPLWMLLLAAVGPSLVAARLLSVLCGALAVLVFGRLARRVFGPTAWAAAATCAWAGSVWLVRHAPNGMESTAGALFVLVAIDLRSRGGRHAGRDVLFGLALAAATLVRPEALLLVVIYCGVDVATGWGRSRLAAWLPSCVAPLFGWAALAHSQTHHILPATGAAKSAGLAFAPLAWARVARGELQILAAGHGVELVGLAVGLGLALRTPRRSTLETLVQHPLLPYGVFTVLLLLAYALVDLQVQPRYLLLVTPAVVLAGFATWRTILGPGKRAAVLLATASLTVGACTAVWKVYPATRAFAQGVDTVLEPMAVEVSRHAGPEVVVATPDIGVMGWFSGVRVLDLGGLVDPRVQALVADVGYDAMLENASFLDLANVEFVLDRSLRAERFADRVTRGLRWRVLRTGAVQGLGISRPATYYYTLYVLEPEHAYGLVR